MVRRWRSGRFELVVSELVLAELARALRYPKLAGRIDPDEAAALMVTLREQALILDDFEGVPPVRSRDPDDDYLVAIANDAGAALVSGDKDLLVLAGDLPIFAPSDFLALLDEGAEGHQ